MAPSKKRKDTAEIPAAVMSVVQPTSSPARLVGTRIGLAQHLTLDEAWEKLLPGFIGVFDLSQANSLKFPYMAHYTTVYNFCVNVTKEHNYVNGGAYGGNGDFNAVTGSALSADGGPAKLAQKIAGFVRDHLAQSFHQEMVPLRDNELLKRYTLRWEGFRFSARVCHGFCQYLNEHFLRRRVDPVNKDLEIYPVYGVCLKEWRDGALAFVQDNLLRAVADVITAHRDGDNRDAFMVRTVVDCLVDLGLTLDYEAHAGVPSNDLAVAKDKGAKHGLQVYQKYLEAPFFKDTRVYYENESREFLAHNSVARYVEKVQARLNEEVDRCYKYLHASTCPNLIKTVEDVMIAQKMPKLRAEVMIYLANEQVEELTAIYALISRVPLCMQELYDAVETHIRQKGQEALAKNPAGMIEDPRLFLTAILDVYNKCLPLIVKSFRNEKEFRAAFDKGFYKFVNENAVTAIAKSSTKSSELFARYCDSMLKKSAKNLSEADLEETLNQFMIAFKYIEDKDVFQKHYQKCLCRRLISGLSASDDAEASMISKLKVVAGWEYVTKLQRMFQDMSLSAEMNNTFRDADSAGRNSWKFEFTVQVLASGSWPLAAGSGVVIPNEMERPLVVFNEFYVNKFNGRKLTWVFPNSRCEISTNGFKIKHFLTVSATQAAIILAFNDQTSRTVSEIRDIIGYTGKASSEEAQFKQILLLLLKSKLFLIANQTDNVEEKDLADDVKIKLNVAFNEKRVRLNLNQPLRAEQKQEDESANRGVEDDRKITIQAAVVRCMKMRKELKHQQLIGETMEMLSTRFKPNVASIKKNIETLIEKEYLRRSDEDRDLYIYMA